MNMQGPAPTLTSGRQAWVERLLFAALVVALPISLAGASKIFNDGDVSWHIATGQWMLAHAAVPTSDPFSLTAAGRPWVATEWLAELIFATAFRLAGYAGISAVVVAALCALQACIFFFLQRRVGPVAIVATILAVDIALGPFIIARPHLLAWPLLAGWTIVLLRAEEIGEAPPLWGALLLPVWSNVHASFPLAAPIGVAIGFDALQRTGWTNWRSWLRFALISLVALMLNANGLRGLMRPFEMEKMAMLPLVQEWQPSTIQLTPGFYAALAVGMFALLYKGVRVPVGRLVLLIGLGALAFSQVRHQSWFAVVAACTLPPLIGASSTIVVQTRWLVPLIIPAVVARALWPVVPVESPANPRHLIAAVPASLRSQPVLNEYTFGGPLILAGIKPYIDGRGDMYGDAFVMDYSRIMEGDRVRFARAVKRYGIRWTMLPSRSKLALELDASAEWTRVYSDHIGVIHVRRD